jgi:23S rRNA (uracil1939-C5)-methyltransferase
MGYRGKARLSVKDVITKGQVLVGFREKHSACLADLKRCDVLHPSVGERLPAIAALIGGLAARSRIPQVEVAVAATALVFRHLGASRTFLPITCRLHASLIVVLR